MAKPYYECHVTVEYGEDLQVLIEDLGWTFSAIDNDIMLGTGTKCYATKHFNADRNELEDIGYVVGEAARLIAEHGFKVLRAKVELVMIDMRYPEGMQVNG